MDEHGYDLQTKSLVFFPPSCTFSLSLSFLMSTVDTKKKLIKTSQHDVLNMSVCIKKPPQEE